MADDDAPKSSYEIAMARLRQKDKAEGVEARSLSDEQRAEIAELRRVHQAKLAEREILHHAALRKTDDPDARAAAEDEYRRDRERIGSERDRKIEQVRKGA